MIRLRLAKGPLCIAIGFSAVFGFLLASPGFSWDLAKAFAGVTLLAGGAGTLNSLQEWRRDALMRRTGDRPLPRGELTVRQAIRQSLALIAAGLLLLSLLPGLLPLFAGLLALLLYNGLYTPLKARTLLAIVPGALCGGLPPVIGWLAGGGLPGSPVALLLMLLLILWQIPHSLLVMLMYRDDFRSVRMPNMLEHLSEQGLRRLLVPWVAALAAAMALFSLPPVNPSTLVRAMLLLPTAVLLLLFTVQTVSVVFRNDKVLFIALNSVFFFNMLVICGARISLASWAGS
jgi:protoheme IX farnesyltransferase